HPSCPMSPLLYGYLIGQGFRRSGDDVYKPDCRHCAACLSARLPVLDFKPSRSQKRCLERNRETQVQVKPAVFEQAHYDLYLRYQDVRHSGGDMARSGPEEYMGFLGSSWSDTLFVEFSIQGRLAALAVVDQMENAWSAVYTFFDPDFAEYSPGVYAVLWQIEQAKLTGREFLYLGFWIQACKKMAYKSQYQPMQCLLDKHWTQMPC
ncbi:MAG: arginyltransferase, partial [Methylovulum sp.]|nr:arginyltransferase [Methylovulum sp.]